MQYSKSNCIFHLKQKKKNKKQKTKKQQLYLSYHMNNEFIIYLWYAELAEALVLD